MLLTTLNCEFVQIKEKEAKANLIKENFQNLFITLELIREELTQVNSRTEEIQ